jgi:hypothetical protein
MMVTKELNHLSQNFFYWQLHLCYRIVVVIVVIVTSIIVIAVLLLLLSQRSYYSGLWHNWRASDLLITDISYSSIL